MVKTISKTNFTTLEQDISNFSSKTKQELFELYGNLSDIIAKNVFKQYKFDNRLEYEDIKQLASIALWNVLDKYDVSKQVKFVTFAFSKMPFLIKDDLRKITKSRNINASYENNSCSINTDYIKNTLTDSRVYIDKENRLIQSIIDFLNQSELPQLSINIFTEVVLYKEKASEVAAKYNICKSRVSQHCIKIRKYLQKHKDKINI